MVKAVRPERVDYEALDARIAQVQHQVSLLSSTVAQVATMNTIEHVLCNGFEALSAELEPLRDLSPRRVLLKPGAIASLHNLYQALARPRWAGAAQLGAPESGVPFIGAVSPDFDEPYAPNGQTSTYERGVAP